MFSFLLIFIRKTQLLGMKLRLLPLSILLVASMAACKKNYPSATVGVNPNAPDPIDSTVKVKDNKWNWSGIAPISFKLDGKMVICGDFMSFAKSLPTLSGDYVSSINGWAGNDAPAEDTIVQMQIPGRLQDMLVGQEYSMPVDANSVALVAGTNKNSDNKHSFYMTSFFGGSMRLKITNKTNEDIEGKFYGVLSQHPGFKDETHNGLGWIKIEEGYFKFKFTDTGAGM
jgi:hypothetical protein